MTDSGLPYNIDDLRKCCADKHVVWKEHSTERMIERSIFRQEVFQCIQNGEIIEKYPDDHPYPSCLVYGVTDKGRPLHVVCSLCGGYVYMITVYEPNTFKWYPDLKTRKEQ